MNTVARRLGPSGLAFP